MATKTAVTLENNTTLTAGAGDTLTTDDISSDDGAVYMVRLTNGATGPTIAARVLVEYSPDGSEYYTVRTLNGRTTNSDVQEWTVVVPFALPHIRFSSGQNTGQNVTLRIDAVTATAF